MLVNGGIIPSPQVMSWFGVPMQSHCATPTDHVSRPCLFFLLSHAALRVWLLESRSAAQDLSERESGAKTAREARDAPFCRWQLRAFVACNLANQNEGVDGIDTVQHIASSSCCCRSTSALRSGGCFHLRGCNHRAREPNWFMAI